MALYAIGDIQGCFKTLQQLLLRLDFHPSRDRLWLTGDLVNRGPRSLAVLRWAQNLGDAVVTVLGNHDLHLLGRAAGLRPASKHDTLEEILNAPDREHILSWLGQRPLLVRGDKHLLIHAGLLPQWSSAEAQSLAAEVQNALRSQPQGTLTALFAKGETPGLWQPQLRGEARLRTIVTALTRLRVCTAKGEMQPAFKSGLDQIPPHLIPWFLAPNRQSQDATIVFGHWAALGLHLENGVRCLDTGCVWGRSLTALRLSDDAVFSQPFAD